MKPLHILFATVVALIGFANGTELVERAPGDLIWKQCRNISQQVPLGNVRIPNACVILTEEANCGVRVVVTAADRTIVSERMDSTIASVVCGAYTVQEQGLSAACNVCVALRNDANQQCVSVRPSCVVPTLGTVNIPQIDAGCFSSDKLSAIEQCNSQFCPSTTSAACSGHGTCDSGKCTCDMGYFGNDCSIKSQLFEKCVRVNQLSGSICTRLIFDNCNVKLQMVLVSGPLVVPLFEQPYPVKTLGVVFKQDICRDVMGCSICVKWNDLVLNEHEAKGCGSLSLVCGGTPVGPPYYLGCFNDNQVMPTCFGTCSGGCSGHGDCNLGLCTCYSGFKGDSCSQTIPPCPSDCNHNGQCKDGQCVCSTGYSGDDCGASIYNQAKSSSKSSFNVAYILVPVILIFGIGAVILAIWYIKKKRDNRPKFNQFDLLPVDDSEDTETPSIN